jgi:hypothetical protein
MNYLRILFVVTSAFFIAQLFGQNIPSTGAKIGWVYYGLLLNPTKSPEKWEDLNFTIINNKSKSNIPKEQMNLHCNELMNLRDGKLVFKSDGTIEWPPTIGFLAPSTEVTIIEIDIRPSKAGTHYWAKVQRP